MRPIGRSYHINIDEETNWKIKMGDTELFFDPEYNLELNTIQVGTVEQIPHRYRQSDQQFGRLADVGDKVYFGGSFGIQQYRYEETWVHTELDPDDIIDYFERNV